MMINVIEPINNTEVVEIAFSMYKRNYPFPNAVFSNFLILVIISLNTFSHPYIFINLIPSMDSFINLTLSSLFVALA